MPKDRQKLRFLLFSLYAVMFFASVLLSYALAGHVNSFLEGLMGKEAQGKLGAPFVEELLKPLGLVVLAAVLLWTSRAKSVKIDWFKSTNTFYAIGYTGGLIFGVLENWLSYREFSGFRPLPLFCMRSKPAWWGWASTMWWSGGSGDLEDWVSCTPRRSCSTLLGTTSNCWLRWPCWGCLEQ